MPRLVERGLQLPLLPGGTGKEADSAVLITSGAMIYPSSGGHGVLQNDMSATPLENKVKGYNGFRATENGTLYLDGRYWTMNAGVTFGTSANHVRK